MRHPGYKPLNLGEGKRFCTTCQAKRDEEGGRWIVSGNRLTRRWRCAQCETHSKEKKRA